jgi:hypothetical protein
MPTTEDFDYLAWYPGDEYVDWWSVDIFSVNFQYAAANANLKEFLGDAVVHGKSVMIPESAPSKQDLNNIAVWNTWFIPYFTIVNNPQYSIRGFCYTNVDFNLTTSDPLATNAMIQGTPLAPLYQEELLKPQYLHQQE